MTAHQVRPYVRPVSTDNPTPAPEHGASTPEQDPVPAYEIRVAGLLAPRWSAWFDGMTIDPAADGTTVIRGPVVDQAALHGLLQKLRDVGIPLVSLTQIPSTAPVESSADAPQKGT
jgi:hypothetical protein